MAEKEYYQIRGISAVSPIAFLTIIYTFLLHGAESFLRSELVCSWSRNSPHFMEPGGSLPHSQASATIIYTELKLVSCNMFKIYAFIVNRHNSNYDLV